MFKRSAMIALALGVCFAASAARMFVANDEAARKTAKGTVTKSIPLLFPSILSPGDSVGVTDFDKQYNAGGRRYICKSPTGGYHFYWTYRSENDQVTRRACYRYLQPPSTWSETKVLHDVCSRMGSISQLKDGRAVASAHVGAGDTVLSYVYIDSAPGACKFRTIQLPLLDAATLADQPIWPNVAIDSNNTIFVTANQMVAKVGWWTVSKDLGETWSPWKDSLAGVQLDSAINWVQIGEESVTAYKNKVAFIVQPYYVYDLLYYETADQGATWKKDTIYTTTDGDSVMAYIWYSGVYDNEGTLHVAYTAIDTSLSTFGGGGGDGGSGWRSQIRYWNSKDRKTQMVFSAWWAICWGPGGNTPTVSQPSIGIDRSNGHLYCVWARANVGDTSTEGFTNLELYGAKSTDRGATWILQQNLTQSPSPGAAPGECENDIRPSIVETVSDDYLDIFYMNDKAAGNSVDDQISPTMNRMLYCKKKLAAVAVKKNKIASKAVWRVSVSPNPFRDRIAIQAPRLDPGAGKQAIRLSIFTTSGRLVKSAAFKDLFVWDGKDERGRGLPAGVYMMQLSTGDWKHSAQMILTK